MKLNIILKQYTTQKRAQRYCQKVTPAILQRRFGKNVGVGVNQLDHNVFQVELNGDFKTNEIDLIGLV